MNKLTELVKKPAFITLSLGVLAGIGLLIWYISKIKKPPQPPKDDGKQTIFSTPSVPTVPTVPLSSPAAGANTQMTRTGSVDVGRDTFRLVPSHKKWESSSSCGNMKKEEGQEKNDQKIDKNGEKKNNNNCEISSYFAKHQDVTMDLPASYSPPNPMNNPEMGIPQSFLQSQKSNEEKRQYLFNSDDINIDPRILQQWALHEMPFQENTTTSQMNGNGNTLLGRSGQVWLKNWEALGPIDPFTPRTKIDGEMVVTPGPTDPQLAYANTLVANMDAQAEKFCVTENPNDVTYRYRNSLNQVPGSHFETTTSSWDPYESPQVINRFSHLAKVTADWVVERLNEKTRKEHPCFSLAGREHFELSHPPQTCGDTANPKYKPITLLRVFEARVKRIKEDESQRVYLTMELANHISGGSGGMFQTVVTVDNKGNIVDYTTPNRDQKQTFVLPRT